MSHANFLSHNVAKATTVAAVHQTTTKKETPQKETPVVSQPVDLSKYISPSKTLPMDTSDDTVASELDAEVGETFEDVVDEHTVHTASTKLVSEFKTTEVGEKHENTIDGTVEAKHEEAKISQISLSGALHIFARGSGVHAIVNKFAEKSEQIFIYLYICNYCT